MKWKLNATILTGKKKERRTILLNSGNENMVLSARFSEVLPGHEIVGVFFYPALRIIEVHAYPEKTK